ncbi:MAG: flavodoxin family protein [Cyanobacteria bacterium J06626_4]
MSAIAIVYFSASGHTHLMAEAIAAGVQQAGHKAELLRITGDQITDGRWQDEAMMATLTAADGIIFGSPTYMGGVAGQFKAFIDAASEAWFAQLWKDKIAAGFTHSSSLSGDKQGTLIYLAINAAQHSMLWLNVGDMPSQYLGKDDGVNRLGSFMGLMGQSPMALGDADAQLDAGDRLTCINFGQRIAEAAERWG